MICQRCLEEYEFLGFKYDWESNRAFGGFSCGCEEKLVLPEHDCLGLGLLDSEGKEQLRHLRLLSLRRQVEGERCPDRVFKKALRSKESVLLRYLSEVSERGLLIR